MSNIKKMKEKAKNFLTKCEIDINNCGKSFLNLKKCEKDYYYYNFENQKKYKEIPKAKSFFNESSNSPSISGFLNIMRENSFHHDNENWDIYIPKGYNNIEKELKELDSKGGGKVIFGIPGCDNVVSKRIIWYMLENLYGREKAQTIMPQTFVLSNEEHMKLFEEKWEEGKTYILKSKKQHKLGLSLTTKKQDILEAKDKDFLIVQDYLKDVLLINNRKINLRIYILLIIENGILKVYTNEHGTCIYNNKDYDPESLDFESNITSFNLDYEIYEKNPLTLKQLRTHLNKNGYDSNILFENLNSKIKLLAEAIKDKVGSENLRNNVLVQIFGADFIIDKNLNPYLLECNKGPDMSPKEKKPALEIIERIEDFYKKEDESEECYPSGYVTGNGLKVQKDTFDLLDLIKSKNKNGFYQIY